MKCPTVVSRTVVPRTAAADDRVPDEIRRFDRALALFEAGAWFTCHEVLEHLWLDGACPGWLQRHPAEIAVGLLHEENGNRAGALRLLERGAGIWPRFCLHGSADLAALRDEALRLRGVMAALPRPTAGRGAMKELLPCVRRAYASGGQGSL